MSPDDRERLGGTGGQVRRKLIRGVLAARTLERVQRERLACVAVVRCAERVFAPGGRPPPELMPLAEPLEQLQAALNGDRADPAGVRWFARRVVDQRDAISWACRRAAPEEVRALGAALAWLTASLEPPERSAAADGAWPSAGSAG